MGESPPKASGVLTGNPFVDWGLSIAAAMAGLESVAFLTDEHLKNVVADGRELELARRHQRLKAFIPVFGSNTPLHNPKRKGQVPGGRHIENYAALLVRIRDAIGREARDTPCEVCGARRSLGAGQLKVSGGRTPSFGRDWLPLAGAATEANLWPAASRSPHTCARCLLALRLLPSALLLVDGRLTILQSAPPEFADIFVRELYDNVRVREQAGEIETLGSKEGKRAFVRRLLTVLDTLRIQRRLGVVDSKTRIFAWYFTNAGDSAEVALEELPNKALLFLRYAVDSGLRPEVERLIATERKDTESTPGLLRSLEQGRDYEPLYPRGKHPGASIDLFEVYQTRILARTTAALEVAHTIATSLASSVRRRQDLNSLRKPEAFRRSEHRARIRQAMVQMAAEGRFRLADYRSLFPLQEGSGLAVVDDGWKVLRYYVHQPPRDGRPRGEPYATLPDSDPVSFIADRMLDRLLAIRGEEFVRGLVGRAEGMSDRWLREQFLTSAWREEGFTYGAWSALALDERGYFTGREWVFQTRLHLAARLSEERPRRVLRARRREATAMPMADSRVPELVAVALEEYLHEYLIARGPGRLERDIVRPWLGRRLGMHWLGERLSSPRRRAPISADTWRDWVEGPGGVWRSLQIGLAVCNAARRLVALRSTPMEEPA